MQRKHEMLLAQLLTRGLSNQNPPSLQNHIQMAHTSHFSVPCSYSLSANQQHESHGLTNPSNASASSASMTWDDNSYSLYKL